MGAAEEKRASRISREIREAAAKRNETRKATKTDAKKRADALSWVMVKKDEQWSTTSIPEGEHCTGRITRSSRNSDGSYSFFCYRNARAVAITKDLEAAKAAVARGTPAEGEDRVLAYVTEHPLDIPPFLALTLEERRAVRAEYPYAAPSAAKVRVAAHRGTIAGGADVSDPGTAALLAELGSPVEKPGRRGAAVPKAPRAPREAAPQGTLARVRDGNPKKPGTGAHKRWETLFAACAAGQTVAAYEQAGHNMDTLANAVKAGYVAVKKEEK